MKKLGFTLLGLVVLLIAGILIGPNFVDWNAHKGRIASEVRELTGRTLTIDGDISLTLLPAPALTANDVRLANIEGGSSPSMIELESLEVRVALFPLVQGQVQVESVVLVRPAILIEILADGRKNWEIVKSEAPTPGRAPGREAGGDMSDQVRLDSVRISDGTMIYRDATTGREERITELNAEIVAGTLRGPFAVSGDALVHDIKVGFEVTLGQLVREGATALNLSLDLPAAGAKAKFGGAISQHPDGMSLRGRIKAEGENLSSLMALLSGSGGRGPRLLARPFGLETEVSADPQQVSASDLMFNLGETAIEGDLRIKLGTPIDARINISASRLDLDKLLAATGPEATGQAGSAPAPDGQTGGQTGGAEAPDPATAPFMLPDDVNGELQVTIDALVYRRQVVRQVLISMELAEGRLKVSQALALLPGGSDVSLTGTLAAVQTTGAQTQAGPELRFDGRIEAASDNLRGICDWLGVDVTAVPAERLRRMSLSVRIAASARQATLSDIDLRVDVSRATGGIAVALRERPGFGIGLAVDKLNLDAYLPPEGAAQKEEKAGEGTAVEGTGGAPEAEAPAGALAALAGFDANLDLKLGSLSLRGVTARDLHLDATLQQGALTVREASIGDLAGSRVHLAGTVSDLVGKPAFDVKAKVSISDPARLAKLANLDTKALSRIGAFELTAALKGTVERLGFDADLDALGGRFGVAGTAQGLAAAPEFDVKVAAKHPNLAKLLRAFDLGPGFDPELGGLDLSAGLRGSPAKFQVTDLSGRFGPATLSGGFGADLSGPEPAVSDADFEIAVKHPDLAGLVRALALEVALGKGLGAVDVKARVTGGSGAVQVSELSGQVGPATLSGSLGVDLSGPEPIVTAVDLAVGIKHPSLAELARAVNKDVSLNPNFGGIDLKGRITGGAMAFKVSELAGRLGETDVSGSLGADLSGAKPAIEVDLTTGELPLAALLAPAGTKGARGQTGAAANKSNKSGPRWSSEPIDVSALNEVNAEVRLASKALLLGDLRLDKVRIEATLTDGLLDLRKLNATLYDGALALTGKLDARKTLEVGLAVTAIELNLARLLRDLAKTDRVSGPLNVNASFTTRGRSEAELVAALAGAGDVNGTLKFKATKAEKAGSALLGLAGELLGQKIKEIGNITNITDATNVLFNAFADAPAAVSGTFTVERGVVRTTDLRAAGRQATALTAGSADLPNWRLDTRTDIYRANDPNTPYLTVDLRGPLDAPNPRVRGAAFQPRLQRAPAPATGPAPSTGPQPSGTGRTQPAPEPAPQQIRPEDLLKKSLEKTLKGLFGN